MASDRIRARELLGVSARRVSWALNSVSVVFIVVLMFMTAADVIARYAFNSPLKGSYELTEMMLSILTFCAIGYTAFVKGHIAVNVVLNRFSTRLRAYITSAMCFIAFAFFALIVWQSLVQSRIMWRGGDETGVLHIPTFPMLWIIAIGCAIVCLVLLAQAFENLSNRVKK